MSSSTCSSARRACSHPSPRGLQCPRPEIKAPRATWISSDRTGTRATCKNAAGSSLTRPSERSSHRVSRTSIRHRSASSQFNRNHHPSALLARHRALVPLRPPLTHSSATEMTNRPRRHARQRGNVSMRQSLHSRLPPSSGLRAVAGPGTRRPAASPPKQSREPQTRGRCRLATVASSRRMSQPPRRRSSHTTPISTSRYPSHRSLAHSSILPHSCRHPLRRTCGNSRLATTSRLSTSR